MSGIEVAFLGALSRDAELKRSKAGKPYQRFTVRVGDGDGASWVSVMYFGDDATELTEKLVQGAKVYCEGSLRLDRWDKAGMPQSGLSCMSFHCRIAAIGRNKPKRERKGDDERHGAVASPLPSSQRPAGSTPANRNDFHDDEIPF